MKKDAIDIHSLAGLRIDGRKNHELRPMKCQFGLYSTADSCVTLEHGLNKVMVMVHGPQEPKKKAQSDANSTDNNKCLISCRFMNAAFSGTERRTHKAGDRRVAEYEKIISEIVTEIIIREVYPRSEIVIVIHVLETDGSMICIIMNAICLALMDAGIAMYDMIAGCSAGYIRHDLCLDLNHNEQHAGGAYLPIVMKARSEEIIYMQLDSRLSSDKLEEILQYSVQGCRQVRSFIDSSIRHRLLTSNSFN